MAARLASAYASKKVLSSYQMRMASSARPRAAGTPRPRRWRRARGPCRRRPCRPAAGRRGAARRPRWPARTEAPPPKQVGQRDRREQEGDDGLRVRTRPPPSTRRNPAHASPWAAATPSATRPIVVLSGAHNSASSRARSRARRTRPQAPAHPVQETPVAHEQAHRCAHLRNRPAAWVRGPERLPDGGHEPQREPADENPGLQGGLPADRQHAGEGDVGVAGQQDGPIPDERHQQERTPSLEQVDRHRPSKDGPA